MPEGVARMEMDLVLQVDLESGETLEYACANANTTFALNSIPFARCTLASGRDAFNLKKATAHTDKSVKGLQLLNRARIVFRPKGEWLPSDEGFKPGDGKWTAVGERIIFDGFLTGSGWRKTQGTMRFVVSLIHWLSDISFSSIVSNQSHPGNAERIGFNAVYGPLIFKDTNLNSFTHSHVAVTARLTIPMQQDLWGKAFHTIFCELAKRDILQTTLSLTRGCYIGDPGTSNVATEDALKRFVIGLDKVREVLGEDCETGAKSPYHVPLTIGFGGIQKLISDTILKSLLEALSPGHYNTTLWDALISVFVPELLFSVVPLVNTALVVPFVPGLRQTWVKTLDAEDITYIDTSTFIPRPIRSVGVIARAQVSVNNAGDTVPIASIGGCYAPDLKATKGMVMYVNGPQWMSKLPSLTPQASQTALGQSKPSDKFKAGGSSTTPPKHDGSQRGGESGLTPIGALNATENIFSRYARFIYVKEALRGRALVIKGKLRFDIGPGSTVLVRNATGRHIIDDALGQNLIGSVQRVGVSLDAESSEAGTTFQLDFVRTEEENKNDKTSVDQHPLYKTIFTGAPLVHEYLFPDKNFDEFLASLDTVPFEITGPITSVEEE